jgi:hypothetical protein
MRTIGGKGVFLSNDGILNTEDIMLISKKVIQGYKHQHISYPMNKKT